MSRNASEAQGGLGPTVLSSPMMRQVPALQCRVLFSCNNACFFCLDRNEEDGLFHGGPPVVARADVERVLRAGIELTDAVVFTHGEPTLHPELPELAELARELGYTRRGVVTNARRLSVPAYARRLLEAGVNRFVLSIHGPDAATHDACTGRKAFAQASAGLANLRDLKNEFDFVLTTSTVVNHLNRHKVVETVRFLLDHRVDTAVLNVVRPMGNAARHFAQVVPRYSMLVDDLERLFDMAPASRHRVAIEDIPPCVAQRIAPMLGVLEAWLAEPSDESAATPIAGALTATPAGKIGGETVFEVGVPERDAVKREACRTCVHDRQCWGVWRKYVAAYGWDELVPVTAEAQRAAHRSPFVQAVQAGAGAEALNAALTHDWRLAELVLDERRERATYDLRHDDGRAFKLVLEPRADARPAFARTRRYNVSYQGSGRLASDEAELLRRLVAWLDQAAWGA